MVTVAFCSAGQLGTDGGHLVIVWNSVEYTVEVVIMTEDVCIAEPEGDDVAPEAFTSETGHTVV